MRTFGYVRVMQLMLFLMVISIGLADIAHGQLGGGDSLFAGEKQKKWKAKKGTWTWQGEKLVGVGPGSIIHEGSFQPPFVAQFEWTPRAGIRNEVHFGNEVSLHNLAYVPKLKLKGMDEAKAFEFKHNTTYKFTVVVARKRSEFYVDGVLIGEGAGSDKKVEKIEIMGGDDWSPGKIEVENFQIYRATDKVPGH